jgi:glycosyltransferase involved in cell wall biosynthesis
VIVVDDGSTDDTRQAVAQLVDRRVRYLVQFVIGVAGPRGIMFTANMLLDGNKLHIGSGSGVFECLFKHVPLMPGAYQLFGEAWGEDGYTIHSQWSEWARLRVASAPRELLPLAESHSVYHLQSDAPILVLYEWRGAA